MKLSLSLSCFLSLSSSLLKDIPIAAESLSERISTLAAQFWWWEIVFIFFAQPRQWVGFEVFHRLWGLFQTSCTLIVSIELLVTGQRGRIVLNLVWCVLSFAPTECKGYIDTAHRPPQLPPPYIVYKGARVCMWVSVCVNVCVCACRVLYAYVCVCTSRVFVSFAQNGHSEKLLNKMPK